MSILKDNLPHNTYQIYVKLHLKNTQMDSRISNFRWESTRISLSVFWIFGRQNIFMEAWRQPLNCPRFVRNRWHVIGTMAKPSLIENLHGTSRERQQKRQSQNDSNGSLHAFFAGTVWRPKIKKRDGLILVPSHWKFDFPESFVCSYYEV